MEAKKFIYQIITIIKCTTGKLVHYKIRVSKVYELIYDTEYDMTVSKGKSVPGRRKKLYSDQEV